jgi:hypothetical protein
LDCQGVKTRIFETGTADLVNTLPATNGKYPDPLFDVTNPAAYISFPASIICTEEAPTGILPLDTQSSTFATSQRKF